jgi:hypothetical protein
MKRPATSLKWRVLAPIDPVLPALFDSIALLSHDPESDRALDRSGASMHVL